MKLRKVINMELMISHRSLAILSEQITLNWTLPFFNPKNGISFFLLVFFFTTEKKFGMKREREREGKKVLVVKEEMSRAAPPLVSISWSDLLSCAGKRGIFFIYPFFFFISLLFTLYYVMPSSLSLHVHGPQDSLTLLPTHMNSISTSTNCCLPQ